MGTHEVFTTQAEITVLSADVVARAQVVMSDDVNGRTYSDTTHAMAVKLYKAFWRCAEEEGFHMPINSIGVTLAMCFLEMARHIDSNHQPDNH